MDIKRVRICLTSDPYTNLHDYNKAIEEIFLSTADIARSHFSAFSIVDEMKYLFQSYCPGGKFETYTKLQIALFRECCKGGTDYRFNAYRQYRQTHEDAFKKTEDAPSPRTKPRLDLMIVHCNSDLEMALKLKKEGFYLYHIRFPLETRFDEFIAYNPGYTDEMESEFKHPLQLPGDKTYDNIFVIEEEDDNILVASTIYSEFTTKFKNKLKELKEKEDSSENLLLSFAV